MAILSDVPALDLSNIGGLDDEDEADYYRKLKNKATVDAAGGSVSAALAARLAARGTTVQPPVDPKAGTVGLLSFLNPLKNIKFLCDLSVREKARRAASQAFERMHNTLSHRVKT